MPTYLNAPPIYSLKPRDEKSGCFGLLTTADYLCALIPSFPHHPSGLGRADFPSGHILLPSHSCHKSSHSWWARIFIHTRDTPELVAKPLFWCRL